MFQFTHPGKGATPSWEASLVILDSFNSRTLGRVRRRRAVRGSLSGQVSIHAPWEGCDTKGTEPNIYRDGFNSRTLGRVRHISHHTPPTQKSFNSRTLGRVRHGGIDAGYVMDSFNSRTLGRVRLLLFFSFYAPIIVSIHAPWEGCDRVWACLLSISFQFQFTHPGKGATAVR